MAITTPNIGLHVTPSTDTTKTVLDWRTELAGDTVGSNMMIIDSEINNLNNDKAEKTELSTHSNDSTKHITAEERSAWNSKADGTHNHDGVYEPKNANIQTHIINTSNPHGVTKAQVGLGNVEDKSSATIRSEITSGNVTTALGYTPLNPNLKGAVNGIAELDESGKVPSSQLPSYVDDVIEVATYTSLPATGEAGKIYIAIDTNLTYRWSGTAYVLISSSLALGETSASAYRGDRGKIAYDHSQVIHDKNLVGLGNVDNTSDANKPISTAVATALGGKVENSRVLTDVPLNAKFTDTVYTHPDSHPATMVTEDATHRFATDAEKTGWNSKQDALVSGINIKTINGTSILGSGDISVSGGGSSINAFVSGHDNFSYTATADGVTTFQIPIPYDSTMIVTLHLLNLTLIRGTDYSVANDGTVTLLTYSLKNGDTIYGILEHTSFDANELTNKEIFATATHKSNHAIGGTDPLTPADIGAYSPEVFASKGMFIVTTLAEFIEALEYEVTGSKYISCTRTIPITGNVNINIFGYNYFTEDVYLSFESDSVITFTHPTTVIPLIKFLNSLIFQSNDTTVRAVSVVSQNDEWFCLDTSKLWLNRINLTKNIGYDFTWNYGMLILYSSTITGTLASKVKNFTNIPDATTTQSGLMSATDKTKLNGSVANVVDGNATGAVRTSGIKSDYTMGEYAFAEGYRNTATGKYAHAEGSYTTASGKYSHAEGSCCVAATEESHAKGKYSLAANGTTYKITAYDGTNGTITLDTVTGLVVGDSLIIKHASDTAKFTAITAISGNTVTVDVTPSSSWKFAVKPLDTASQYATYAEGHNALASGNYSHAQNYYTVAQGRAQTVIGEYNLPQGSPSSKSSSDHAFMIGNGSSESNRSNAMSVTWDGTLNVAKDVTVGGVSVTSPTGAVIMWAGSTTNIPTGWLLCNGAVLNISTYPKLFDVLGINYGGNGLTTFALPSLTGTLGYIIKT